VRRRHGLARQTVSYIRPCLTIPQTVRQQHHREQEPDWPKSRRFGFSPAGMIVSRSVRIEIQRSGWGEVQRSGWGEILHGHAFGFREKRRRLECPLLEIALTERGRGIFWCLQVFCKNSVLRRVEESICFRHKLLVLRLLPCLA